MAEKFINNKLMTQQTWRQMACPQEQPLFPTHLTVAQMNTLPLHHQCKSSKAYPNSRKQFNVLKNAQMPL
jgi:hypothetical protein